MKLKIWKILKNASNITFILLLVQTQKKGKKEEENTQ